MSAYKQKLNTAKLFMLLTNETTGKTKINEIIEYLDEGANIDEQFVDDSNNTPLHISVTNSDIDVVSLLLKRGAKMNYKNSENKTALDIARELNTDVGRAIIELLEAYETETQTNINGITEADVTTDMLSIIKHDEMDPNLMYVKETTATGIKGQLYETKLLSLVLIRASLNHKFDEFYLGTSLDGIGALDDICIRYRNGSGEGVVFLQAKHRSDVKKNKVTSQDLRRNEGDFSLLKYYNSYSTIRRKFQDPNVNDLFFRGKYEDLKCTCVIYTTAECGFKDEALVDVDCIDKTARDLINSGDYSDIFRYNYDEDDISLLTNMLVADDMKYVGKILAYFILKGKYDMLMNDDYIKKYHIILARNVINVSDTTTYGYRKGTFRKDFLSSQDTKLVALRLILYKEFLLAKKPKEKVMKEIVNAVINNPSEETISILMQNAITGFDRDKALIIEDDRYKDVTIKRFRLSQSYEMCSNAFATAVSEMLGTITFNLPPLFGNIDVAVADGNKGEKRLEFLAENVERLINSTIPEPALVALKGGLGSAVGNLLILNEQKTHLILNKDENTLGKNALYLLGKLKTRVKDIDALKFNLEVFNFPNLTLDDNEAERRSVRMFLNDLWFYTRQSKEDEIEDHAKDVIQDYCIANKHEHRQTASNARYDAIYFIVHDEVQKWWMTDERSYYLTNKRDYFNGLLKQFSGKSLLTVISCMFVNRMKKYDVKFNKDAIDYLSSQVEPEATVLITEVRTLTGIKLAQRFSNLNSYAFIDLNDVTCLSKNDYDSIIQELRTIKLKLLIIIYEDVTEAKTKVFLRLTEKSVTQNYILVTNNNSVEKLRVHVTRDTFVTLSDVRNDLTDLDIVSQEKVLERAFVFQGVRTSFSKVITHERKNLIKSKILQRVLNNETIHLGKTLTNPYYEDVKHYYVQRSLRRQESVLKAGPMEPNGNQAYNKGLIKINTLEELTDTVVIVGAPGMGKSTFLTYLSLQTKEQNPSIWIERINLLDQTKELYRLQKSKIRITKIDALKFVCKAALSRNLIRFCIKPTPVVNFDLIINNGEVVLANCNEIDYLVMFELEMLVYSYNHGRLILLFDGFDEICPHYEKEMIEILKCLVTKCSSNGGSDVKQRMWITGRSYNNIRETLDNEFCVSYNLEAFNNEEQERFIDKYLNVNMNLNEIDLEQFKRVDGFFEFMRQFVDDYSVMNTQKIIKITSYFLYSLYKSAMKYFNAEINKTRIPEKKIFCEKWNRIFNSKSSCYVAIDSPETCLSKHSIHKSQTEEALSLIFTPLHIYIVLEYFQNQIKSGKRATEENISMKWDLEMNTLSFYEHFIVTKLKKIRFEEKNQMDLFNPDIMMTYEKELKEFMHTHKKLAFYVTFRDDLREILTEADMEEIQSIIQNIEGGREKTGIIDCILSDGTPKFIHYSFQEYLAAEYISDTFKTGEIERVKLWRFIFSKVRSGVLDFFDRKLEYDVELMNIIKDTDVKQAIFNDLTLDQADSGMNNDNILNHAMNFGLKHIIKMLLQTMSEVVCHSNLDKFISFVNKLDLFHHGFSLGWDEILIIIINCIRRHDPSKLIECNLGVLQTRSYKDLTDREIIRDVKWRMIRDKHTQSKKKTSVARRKTV